MTGFDEEAAPALADSPPDVELDDELEGSELDGALAAPPEVVAVVRLWVVVVPVAGRAAMAPIRPAKAAVDSPATTRRARAAAWRRGPGTPARGKRRLGDPPGPGDAGGTGSGGVRGSGMSGEHRRRRQDVDERRIRSR